MVPAGGCASGRSPRAMPRTRSAARISRPWSCPRWSSAAASTTGTRSWASPCAARTAPSSGRSATSTASARTTCWSWTAGRSRRSTCPWSAPSSGSSRRAAARSWSMPTSLDLRPAKSKTPDPDRPKAPRRRTRRPTTATETPTATEDAVRGHHARSRGRRGRAAAAMTLEIDVLTLFPAMFDGPLGDSIPGRIQERGLAEIRVRDLRAWGLGKHRSVDDAPYGGGAGHGPAAGAGRGRARRAAPAGLRRDPDGPRRRGLPPRPGRRPRHADALHRRLPALRGRGRPHPLAASTSSSRSATTSSPAGSCRRWSSSTPSCVCSPARSTRPPRPRSRSAPASSSTRSTRARRRSGAWTCPRSSPRATTARSGAGGRSRRWPAPASAAPTCWTGRQPPDGADRAADDAPGRVRGACYTPPSVAPERPSPRPSRSHGCP